MVQTSFKHAFNIAEISILILNYNVSMQKKKIVHFMRGNITGHFGPTFRGARRIRKVVLRHEPRGHQVGRVLGKNMCPQSSSSVPQNTQEFRFGNFNLRSAFFATLILCFSHKMFVNNISCIHFQFIYLHLHKIFNPPTKKMTSYIVT